MARPRGDPILLGNCSLMALAGQGKGNVNIAETFEALAEAMQAVESWTEMIWVMLQGFESLEVVATKCGEELEDTRKYPRCLEEYQAHMNTGRYEIDLGSNKQQRSDAVVACPIIKALGTFYWCKKRIADELEFPGDAWRELE